MKSSIGLMDYNTFISKILTANPNLALNPNSQLAKAAVDQYNTKVKQTPTLIRPPIPSWFCGYQNTETGQLYLSEYEINTNRVKTITSSTSLPLSAVTAIQVRYESDRCLGQGTPGSYSYSFCNLATSLQFDDTEIDVIDWSTAFYPIELITNAITQITDTVFDSVQTSIAVEAARVSGNTEWAGASGTGVWDGKEAKILDAVINNGYMVMHTEGIVGNPQYPLWDGDTYCQLFIHTHTGRNNRSDYLRENVLNGAARKIPEVGKPEWTGSVNRGEKVKLECKAKTGASCSISGITWNGPSL